VFQQLQTGVSVIPQWKPVMYTDIDWLCRRPTFSLAKSLFLFFHCSLVLLVCLTSVLFCKFLVDDFLSILWRNVECSL